MSNSRILVSFLLVVAMAATAPAAVAAQDPGEEAIEAFLTDSQPSGKSLENALRMLGFTITDGGNDKVGGPTGPNDNRITIDASVVAAFAEMHRRGDSFFYEDLVAVMQPAVDAIGITTPLTEILQRWDDRSSPTDRLANATIQGMRRLNGANARDFTTGPNDTGEPTPVRPAAALVLVRVVSSQLAQTLRGDGGGAGLPAGVLAEVGSGDGLRILEPGVDLTLSTSSGFTPHGS